MRNRLVSNVAVVVVAVLLLLASGCSGVSDESAGGSAPATTAIEADPGADQNGEDQNSEDQNSADENGEEPSSEDQSSEESSSEEPSSAEPNSEASPPEVEAPANVGPPLSDFTGGFARGEDVIAVLGAGGAITLHAIDGAEATGEMVVLRESAANRSASQPTWSPDGRFLAWTEFDFDGSSDLIVATNDGTSLRRFPTGGASFYTSWDPTNSGSLLTLGNGAAALALTHLDVFAEPETDPPEPLFLGGPIFTHWSPDGRRIAGHFNGEITVVADVLDWDDPQPVFAGGGYPTPIWTDNDLIVGLAEPDGGGVAALIGREVGIDGVEVGVDVEVAEYMVAPNGAWIVQDRPGDSLLVQQPLPLTSAPEAEPDPQLVAAQTEPEFRPVIGLGIDRVALATGEVERVLDEPALAFFANPVDRRVLAFLAPQAPGRISPEWVVLDGTALDSNTLDSDELDSNEPDGGDTGVLERFPLIPSNNFVQGYLPFFDQFAPQSQIWSPDGSRAVLAGREVDGIDGAWIIDGSGDAEPSRIVDAVAAFWRPSG